MAFELCLRLGLRHPDVLLRQLTWQQWLEWEEFYAANPWGEFREDLRQAVGISLSLAPFSESAPPSVIWPYFGEDLDPQEALEAIAQHKAKYGLP